MISFVPRAELLNNGWGLLGTSSATVVGVPALREAGELNEPLRRALLRARLREDDVAARLGVDPKTVRRWLDGRIPYANNRAALADLVGADEADLWPDAGGPLTARTRPEELGTVYPHRWSVPREVWAQFFASAEHEIDILAYSGLFLAEDADILRILTDKGHVGVTVRIALADPDCPNIAERGEEKSSGDAMPARIRNSLILFSSLREVENVEIRFTRPSCTTRSIVPTISFSSTSTLTVCPLPILPSSACARSKAAKCPPATSPASSESGQSPPCLSSASRDLSQTTS